MQPNNEEDDVIMSAIACPGKFDARARRVISKWTEVQQREARAWASAFRTRTTSSSAIDVPEEPLPVFELRRGIASWRGHGERAEDVYRIPAMPAVLVRGEGP
jgi:hypothetical protein